MTDRLHDLLILGGGPAGYTAALYAARSGMDVTVLEKLSAGGQMGLTAQIDNYPGFPEGIDGFTLGQQMQAGAERFGARTLLAEVTEARLEGPVKELETSEGLLKARAVILATGAVPRHLGLAGEEALTGRGVNYCAACDGMFYKGKTVAVVGGGNSAVGDALLLARVAKEVILIHRRDTLRASSIYDKALAEAENLTIRWNTVVTELLHDQRLTGLALQDTVTGETSTLPCDGVFVSVGRAPSTELFRGQVTLDPAGYIQADETTRTNLPGVFAVGDVRTKPLRQVVTAVADGAVAVHYAEEYLAQQPTA